TCCPSYRLPQGLQRFQEGETIKPNALLLRRSMKSSETLLFIQKFTNHLARNKQIDNLCESRRKNETFTYLRALLSNRIARSRDHHLQCDSRNIAPCLSRSESKTSWTMSRDGSIASSSSHSPLSCFQTYVLGFAELLLALRNFCRI